MQLVRCGFLWFILRGSFVQCMLSFSCVLSEDVASSLSLLSLLLRGFLGAGLRSALWVGDVCRHSCKWYARATCGGCCVVFADVAGLSVWVLASFW